MASLSKSDVEKLIAADRQIAQLVIPADVEEIEKDAFLPLTYIKNVKIISESPDFIVENNCLYNAKSLVLYFATAENGGFVKVPDCVKKINLYSFPEGVTEIQVASSMQEIPLKAAKCAVLKSSLEKHNQMVKSKRERILAIKEAAAKARERAGQK